jgi:hypothetical protein
MPKHKIDSESKMLLIQGLAIVLGYIFLFAFAIFASL